MKLKYPDSAKLAISTLPDGLPEDKLGMTWALEEPGSGKIYLVEELTCELQLYFLTKLYNGLVLTHR